MNFSTLFNSLLLISVFLGVFFFLKKGTNNRSRLGSFFLYLFTIEHFLITFIFSFFLEKFTTINDPQRFYRIAQESDNWFSLFGFGNTFMSFLIYPLVKIGVSLEIHFFIFSFLGWIGFLKLFKLLAIKDIRKIHLYHLFFFLPTIHLWTSSLSKEPVLLFLMVSILTYCKNFKLNKWFLTLFFILVLLIRPHVFIILFFVFLGIYYKRKSKSIKNYWGWIILLIMFFLAFIYVTSIYFVRIESVSFNSFMDYYNNIKKTQSNLGNSGISLIETSFFQRVLYLICFPLPFLSKTNTIFQNLASLENLYYVLVLGNLFFLMIKNRGVKFIYKPDLSFALLNGIFMILMFASYLYNLGLGNRMRIMFFPFIFYVLIASLNNIKEDGF